MLKYYFYTKVFLFLKLYKLFSHYIYNYVINLKPEIKLNYELLYKMLRDKLLVLKKYLEDNLYKRFI